MNNKNIALCALLLNAGLYAESEQLSPHETLIAYRALAQGKLSTIKNWEQNLLQTAGTSWAYAIVPEAYYGMCHEGHYVRGYYAAYAGPTTLTLLAAAAAMEASDAKIFDQELAKLTKDDISNKTEVLIGGEPYLLAKDFDDISTAHDGNHYELYLMPRNGYLIDIFKTLAKYLDKNLIAFLALRPISYIPSSICSNKTLPRIIIGFKSGATKEDVEAVVDAIPSPGSDAGRWFGARPWYSDEIKGSNKLLYASFGSGDYKETPEGQQEYAPMKSTSYWRYITSNVEDMAYKNEGQRLRQSVKNK